MRVVLFLFAMMASVAIGTCTQCCVPDQWEGREELVTGIVMNGSAKVEKGVIDVSYDMTNNRIYVQTNLTFDSTPIVSTAIQDYSHNVQYVITDGRCTKTNLGSFTTGCVPDDAHVVRNTFIGVGSQSIPVRQYSLKIDGMDADVTMAVDNCIPISETITGVKDGNQFMSTVTFSGITPGIRDPSVFVVPDICKHAPMIHIPVPQGNLFGRR